MAKSDIGLPFDVTSSLIKTSALIAIVAIEIINSIRNWITHCMKVPFLREYCYVYNEHLGNLLIVF
ncbi:hypothetical protein EOM82_09900 [bacterium]|nr:hypothetical protein [bacterium]